MKFVETTTYPVRYAAAEEHGVLFLAKERPVAPGREWAAYAQTMPNRQLPGSIDGVWADVSCYQKQYLLVNVYASAPSPCRPVWTREGQFELDKFDVAVLQAQVWITEATLFTERNTF